MVSLVNSEIQGGGAKAKKVGNSLGVPRHDRPMVGTRKLLESSPEGVGLLEFIIDRSVSVTEVDAASQVW